MAHFYGSIKGTRGEATRLGDKKSGLQVYAASWTGAVYVGLYHNSETGQDMATVSLVPWHGSGSSRTLYVGPVSGGEGVPLEQPSAAAVKALRKLEALQNEIEKAALVEVFGEEWSGLSEAARSAVLQDFAGLVKDEYLDGGYSPTGDEEGDTLDAAREYRRRIGGGNLASYGEVMQKKTARLGDLVTP